MVKADIDSNYDIMMAWKEIFEHSSLMCLSVQVLFEIFIILGYKIFELDPAKGRLTINKGSFIEQICSLLCTVDQRFWKRPLDITLIFSYQHNCMLKYMLQINAFM